LAARGGTSTKALAVVLSAVAVASLPATVAAANPAASSAGLDAQAQQLQAQIVANGAALHHAALALASARAKVAAVDAQMAADEATLSDLQANLSQATAALRTYAVNDYMSDSQTTTALSVFATSPMQAAATSAYEDVATADTAAALAAFRQAAAAAAGEEAALQAEQAAAAVDVGSVAREVGALQAAVQSENSALAKVHQEQLALATGPPSGVDAAALLAGNGTMAEDLYRLRQCESGDNYQDNTGNGYYGAYQFSMSTWEGLGYGGLPSDAPPPDQDQAAIRLQQAEGWRAWPACSAMLGLD
jgi:hypothetical protein